MLREPTGDMERIIRKLERFQLKIFFLFVYQDIFNKKHF